MSDQIPDSPSETRSGPFLSATVPAIGRTESEDVTGIFEGHTAWVLDGADDPLADKSSCPHGARWYVHSLHSALTHCLLENQPQLDVLLERAIQRVRRTHEKECQSPSYRRPSATVGIFRCGSGSLDYLVLGDASIVLESSSAVVHITDRRLNRIAQDVRYTILRRLQQGCGYDDPLRPDLLRELVTQEQAAQNTATGYSIASYDPGAAFSSVTESLPFSTSEPTIDRVALLSDGAERAVSIFGLYSDWRHFMKTVSAEGPAECINRLREAELLDHSGQQYPRTKFSDDASIVLWTARQGEHPTKCHTHS